MSKGGAELPGFFNTWSLRSGIDPSAMSVAAGKPLKLPKESTPPSITLSRGFDSSLTLSQWSEAALRGDPNAPADVVLTGYDNQLQQVARWHLTRAWPSQYEVGPTGEKESVTIVGETLERVG